MGWTCNQFFGDLVDFGAEIILREILNLISNKRHKTGTQLTLSEETQVQAYSSKQVAENSQWIPRPGQAQKGHQEDKEGQFMEGRASTKLPQDIQDLTEPLQAVDMENKPSWIGHWTTTNKVSKVLYVLEKGLQAWRDGFLEALGRKMSIKGSKFKVNTQMPLVYLTSYTSPTLVRWAVTDPDSL